MSSINRSLFGPEESLPLLPKQKKTCCSSFNYKQWSWETDWKFFKVTVAAVAVITSLGMVVISLDASKNIRTLATTPLLSHESIVSTIYLTGETLFTATIAY